MTALPGSFSSTTNQQRSSQSLQLVPGKKIKLLCETRWVEGHTAVTDFRDMYEAVVHCLSATSGDIPSRPLSTFDSNSVTEASGLVRTLTSDAFIVTLQSNIFLSAYTKRLKHSFARLTPIDVVEAYEEYFKR